MGNGRQPSSGNGYQTNNGNNSYSDVDEDRLLQLSTVNGTLVSGGELFALPESAFTPSFTDAYEQTEVLTGEPAQRDAIEKAVYDLLDAFNVNWDDPNYTATPKRVAKAYTEFWAAGYGRTAEDEVTVFPNSSGNGDLVMVKDMRFYSMCSHHLAPFSGYAAIAYVPDQHLLGLSKLGRILDIYARRFQLQERIGAQTADKLMELVEPQGVMVVLYDVEHMCMSSRGVKLHEASTTTTATRGVFKTSAQMRNEVMTLLQSRSQR